MKANELNKAAEEYAQDETMSGLAERAFKAGAEWQRGQSAPTCKSCGFYENNCPFIRDTFKPYPNKEATFDEPHWKPSKEQMEALNAVANEGVLLDLFNDLLKLL